MLLGYAGAGDCTVLSRPTRLLSNAIIKGESQSFLPSDLAASHSCLFLQGAGTIHSDFERGFICAEVMHFNELKELGTESAVKAAGKYRQEGKGYVLQDGDVCFFKFNVTASKK